MELVHGVPITKYCDDNHLPLRERLGLFVPVCQAIQHAHQKGIIHRDIKPTNVMVTLYDGQPVPKVIDFGVAKATEQKLTERTLFTQYGTMVGTLEYMSPEQAEMSALGVDTRSDIYSLGVLLYELLTGSTPLCHKKMKEAAYAEILRMIREEEPQRPSTRLSSSGAALASISAQRQLEPAKLTRLVRGELDWIVMKALEKDRNRRYETANGLAQDVEHYLRDEPVAACPPSAWYSFRKFARRHKRGLLTAAVWLWPCVLTAAARAAGSSGGPTRTCSRPWRSEQREAPTSSGSPSPSGNGRRTTSAGWSSCSTIARRSCAAGNGAISNGCGTARLSPLRHESAVYSVAFSPDGQYSGHGDAGRDRQTLAGQDRPGTHGNGRLTQDERHLPPVQPQRPIPRLGRLGCEGQGLGGADGPAGRDRGATVSARTRRAGSGCGVWTSARTAATRHLRAAGPQIRKGK